MTRWVRYHATLLFACAMRLLPRRAAIALGGAGGASLHLLLASKRRQAVENLRIAFPQASEPEFRRLARASFVSIGRNVVDMVRFARADATALRDLIEIRGLEHFEAADRAGRGIVAVTAHVGAWEILPAVFADRGYRVNVLVRPIREGRWNPVLSRLRERERIRILDVGCGTAEAIRALRRGEVVGLLADARPLRRGRPIPFFGRPAPTAVGPHALAKRTGAALLPVAIRSTGDLRHVVEVGAPIPVGDVEETLAAVSRALEDRIREEPAQWVWMYHRWRERSAFGGAR